MKNTYPIILMPDKVGYVVYVPDFNINTEGNNITEAIEMARDAIGAVGIEMEDRKCDLPKPTATSNVTKDDESYIITLVDVDFAEYRRKNDLKSVRRNVTLPSWLDFEASKSGVNVSAILQKALKQELHLTDR